MFRCEQNRGWQGPTAHRYSLSGKRQTVHFHSYGQRFGPEPHAHCNVQADRKRDSTKGVLSALRISVLAFRPPHGPPESCEIQIHWLHHSGWTPSIPRPIMPIPPNPSVATLPFMLPTPSNSTILPQKAKVPSIIVGMRDDILQTAKNRTMASVQPLSTGATAFCSLQIMPHPTTILFKDHMIRPFL